MLFRPHRSTLAEAMAEVREFDGTRAGLQALLGRDEIDDVKRYVGDDRIGWDTYIVTARLPPNDVPHATGFTYVVGFTNGPVPA